jgi:hypothetical protein
MWRLTTMLDLNQSAAEAVFDTVASFDRELRKVDGERADAIRGLERELGRGTSARDATLLPCIERVLQADRRARLLEQRWLAAMRASLSPLQQAKLLLQLPRLERAFTPWRSVLEARPPAFVRSDWTTPR